MYHVIKARHHHVISIMSKTHDSKASYSMGSNHMHQWRLWRHKASSRHLQAASSSNKLHLHHLGSTTSNKLHEHHLQACDHCKGHHHVSRLHIIVVVIKCNHQAGVGINDNLQQHQWHLCWSVWALHGLFESYVCHWCQLSLWLRSCPWFRPLVEPLVCVYCCVVCETFSSYSSPSLKPLRALEMSQKPLWVGKKPLWVCVWSPIIILLFLMINSLICPKTLILPRSL